MCSALKPIPNRAAVPDTLSHCTSRSAVRYCCSHKFRYPEAAQSASSALSPPYIQTIPLFFGKKQMPLINGYYNIFYYNTENYSTGNNVISTHTLFGLMALMQERYPYWTIE